MSGFATSVPLFLPGIVLSVALGLAMAPACARALGTRTGVALLLILSTGTMLSATMTPLLSAIGGGMSSTGACDLRRVGWAPLHEYLRVSEPSLNVLLCVPLGFAIGLLPSTTRWLTTAGALLLPFLIEMGQMLVPTLGRGCETADLVDNVSGLLIGLFCGVVATNIAHRTGRADRHQPVR